MGLPLPFPFLGQLDPARKPSGKGLSPAGLCSTLTPPLPGDREATLTLPLWPLLGAAADTTDPLPTAWEPQTQLIPRLESKSWECPKGAAGCSLSLLGLQPQKFTPNPPSQRGC